MKAQIGIGRFPDSSRCNITFSSRAVGGSGPSRHAGCSACSRRIRPRFEQITSRRAVVSDRFPVGQQRMRHVRRRGAEVGGELAGFARIAALPRPGPAPSHRGRGDQLHSPRDLADIADRLPAFHDGPCFVAMVYTAPASRRLNCACETFGSPRPTAARSPSSICAPQQGRAHGRLLLTHIAQELLLPGRHVLDRHLVEIALVPRR